jgi:glutathione synthase/RimK-type ligase-like ATP-grasp enzyme
MKIAINGLDEYFSAGWVAYCDRIGVAYKLVNCRDSDIVKQVADCDIVMWQHRHYDSRDKLIGRQLLAALEQAGKIVFPDHRTGWHFDDKLGQKYLFEAIDAPVAPTVVFFEEQHALAWAKTASYPTVFKLRSGSGSTNVTLVHEVTHCRRLINKAFGRGFSQYNGWTNLKDAWLAYRRGKARLRYLIRHIGQMVSANEFARAFGRERGYAMFQQFMPGNDSDIRVITIGNRAFSIRRMVRPNDFRASGSGLIQRARDDVNEACVRIAFDASKKLGAQCLGYDFVFDRDGQPRIVEVSFGFAPAAYRECPGHWDSDLNWHEGKFVPEEWMVDLVIEQAKCRQSLTQI